MREDIHLCMPTDHYVAKGSFERANQCFFMASIVGMNGSLCMIL